MKVWVNEQKNDDMIVAVSSSSILKANPKNGELHTYVSDIKNGVVPTDRTMEIPFSYIREFQLDEKEPYFDIYFGGDSSESFKVQSLERRKEIFDYLKSNVKGQSKIEIFGGFKAARKSIIAFAVLLGIFLWSFSLAVNMEKGIEYEVVGQQRSIASIVVFLGSLGVKRLSLIFGALMALSIYFIVRKFKSSTTIHRLIVERAS
jgi:hypothetical protein